MRGPAAVLRGGRCGAALAGRRLGDVALPPLGTPFPCHGRRQPRQPSRRPALMGRGLAQQSPCRSRKACVPSAAQCLRKFIGIIHCYHKSKQYAEIPTALISTKDKKMRFTRQYNLISIAAAVSNYIIYNYQNSIPIIVHYRDLCETSTYNSVKWVFPKVIFRCKLIDNPHVQGIPGINILAMFDIWVALWCVGSFVYFMFMVGAITENDIHYHWSKLGKKLEEIRDSIYFYCVVIVLGIGVIFIVSPVIESSGFDFFLSPLSSYGIGAIILGYLSISTSMSVFLLIFNFKAYRSLLQNSRE